MRKVVTTLVVAAFALAGCSEAADDVSDTTTAGPSPSTTSSPSESGSPSEPSDDAIAIKIDTGKISPKGERVEFKTGEAITFKIDSDRAGELHVHSTPEQEFAFEKGKSTVELTIDTPGIVDVEEHESGVTILQLEVS